MLDCKYDKQGSRGQMAVTAFIASAVLVVGVVAVVYYSQKEDSMVSAFSKSSIAGKMAEQALSRAAWKIEESVDNWETLMDNSQTLTGYNFDKKFTEGDGEYCIQIASATSQNCAETDLTAKVVITAIGRDKNGTDVKALKAVYRNESVKPDFAVYILNEKKHKRKKKDKHDEYKKSAMLTPLVNGFYAYVQSLPDQFVTDAWADDDKDEDDFNEEQMAGVHWGPIVAYGDLKLNKKNTWQLYPRKMATGNIKGRDSNGSNAPNSDGLEWWSYDETAPSPPSLNFAYYRAIARGEASDTINFPGGGVYHTKGNGSACIPSHGERSGDKDKEDKDDKDDEDNHWLLSVNDTLASPRVYYYDDVNCKITGDTFINGAVIVYNKKLHVKEGKRNRSTGEYTCDVPPNAWGEYLKLPDTSASGEYPADTGYHQVANTYTFSGDNTVTIKGLVYATKEVQLKGSATVHGVVIVGKKFKWEGSAKARVFYDHKLKVKASELSLVQENYNEIKTSWPAALQ